MGRARRTSSKRATQPSSSRPWLIHFFQRHRDDDPEQRVLARAFLLACPEKVRAMMVAVVHRFPLATAAERRRRSFSDGLDAVLCKNGRSQPVSLLDVVLPGRSRGALLVRAYQRWAGTSTGDIGEASRDVPMPPIGDPLDAIVLKTASGKVVRPLLLLSPRVRARSCP
jgi:hypothetical protein